MGRGLAKIPRFDLRGEKLQRAKAEALAALTVQQRRFVEEYPVDLNTSQAAIRAKFAPKTAGQAGSRLMARPEVQRAIGLLLAEQAELAGITVHRVVTQLWRNHCRAIKGTPIYSKQPEPIYAPEPDETGERQITGWKPIIVGWKPDITASNQALIALGDYLQIFKKQVDVTTGGDKLPGAAPAEKVVMIIGGVEVEF